MTTATAVDHGITIERQPWHAPGSMHLAMCVCGWTSALIADRRRAVAAGMYHVEDTKAQAMTHPNWCACPDQRGCFVVGKHDHIGEATGSVEAEVFEPGPGGDSTTVTVYASDFAGMPAGVQTHVFNESDNGLYVDTDFILTPDRVDALIAALSVAAAQVRAWEAAR